VSDALSELGFDDFVIRINHRQMLTNFLDATGVPTELHGPALTALDKLDKAGLAEVGRELLDRGVSAGAIRELTSLHESARAWGQKAPRGAGSAIGLLDSLLGQHDTLAKFATNDADRNLRAIFEMLDATEARDRVLYDPFLARGLSYYTGAIMEINVADLAGSLGGGGRYDNLVGMFLGQDIPACGFSLGLERILVVMTERNMFPASLAMTPADVMIATFDASSAGEAMRVASGLRAQGLRVLVYPDADKIGKQIKYADGRGIPFVALLGEDEIKGGTLTVKNLAAQTQQTYDQSAAGAAIFEALRQRG
jgi:histidyl-tRNA synthetase